MDYNRTQKSLEDLYRRIDHQGLLLAIGVWLGAIALFILWCTL